jgi:Ca2+-dependent lipid-binding protein
MDEENLSKDRSLGEVDIALSDYIHEDENGEYEVDEEKQDIKGGLRMNGRGAAKGFLNYNIAFYPTLNVYDPEEDAEEEEEEDDLASLPSRGHSKQNSIASSRKSNEAPRPSTDVKSNGRLSVDTAVSKAATNGGLAPLTSPKAVVQERPKIHIEAADLTKYGTYQPPLADQIVDCDVLTCF